MGTGRAEPLVFPTLAARPGAGRTVSDRQEVNVTSIYWLMKYAAPDVLVKLEHDGLLREARKRRRRMKSKGDDLTYEDWERLMKTDGCGRFKNVGAEKRHGVWRQKRGQVVR